MTRARLVVLAAVLAPLLWCFGQFLFSGRTLAFRDAANYHRPTFEWQCRQWGAGRIPLWNPHDNGGMPLVGDATSSVFYPGKLLFALPFDFNLRYNLYIMVHALLAAATAYALARRFLASVEAAGLCAVSYAFGGNVLFQYCNVVFLIGAAWLPLALLASDRMLERRSLRWSLVLGSVLALMVLGGDPQMAYHAGLLAALYACLMRKASRREVAPVGQRGERAADTSTSGYLRCPLSLLAIAACSGLMLSAIQVLPAVGWTRTSERSVSRVPRSVYEVGVQLARSAAREGGWQAIGRGLFADPQRGTHQAHIYQYSVGPWRFAELLWPNVYGRTFPENRRWISALRSESRVWTPSMYMGLLPLLLGLGGWSLRSPCRRRVWLSWCVLFAAVGSLGWFGLGWALHELRVEWLGAERQDVVLGRPVGGLYWLLVVLLPGYVYFRFPAKLLVIAALGLSVLAAGHWDRSDGRPLRSVWLLLIGGTSLLAGALILVLPGVWQPWIERAAIDRVFGPLDEAGALQDVLVALVHSAVVALVCWLLFCRRVALGKAAGSLALLITSIDLMCANGWMTSPVPARVFDAPPAVAQRIAAHAARRAAVPAWRTFRAAPADWTPHRWAQSASPARLADVVAWEHDSLLPRYHWRAGVSLVESSSTMQPADLGTLLAEARRRGVSRPDGRREPARTVLDAFSADYLLLPAGMALAGTERIAGAGSQLPDNVELWFNPHSAPKAWVVHRVVVLPPLRSLDAAAIEARTREALWPDGQLRDLRREAVLESGGAVDSLKLPQADQAADEFCRILRYDSAEVELDVALAAAGCVVLNDSWAPGWRAARESSGSGRREALTVHRANRVMRGVLLPAGRHRIVFRYRPTDFFAAAACSALSWAALLLCWCSSRLWTARPSDARQKAPAPSGS